MAKAEGVKKTLLKNEGEMTCVSWSDEVTLVKTEGEVLGVLASEELVTEGSLADYDAAEEGSLADDAATEGPLADDAAEEGRGSQGGRLVDDVLAEEALTEVEEGVGAVDLLFLWGRSMVLAWP